MEHVDLTLKIVGSLISGLGLLAGLYNIVSSRTHAKQLAKERHDTDRLDQVVLLAAKTEQRVSGLENRHNNLETRVDRRLDQIANDIGKVKDLFTDYLIKH
jgi:hypothetical protein